MKTCIVGLGETGKAITALLITTFKNSSLTIIDPSDHISGRLLDLKHAASFTNSTIALNDYKKASEAQYIFFCAGVRNQKDQDRASTAKTNKALINAVFSNFQPHPEAKIIVVTNPVELITEWISEYFNNKLTVVGTGTGLDQYRLKWIIHEYTNTPLALVEVPVIGEHGEGMTPIYSLGKIGNRPAEEVFSETERTTLTQQLKKSAKTIRITEEATSYGVAQCALYILHAFEKSEPTTLPVSVEITAAYQKLLEIEAPIFISIPCEISSNGITKLTPPIVNALELEQLNKAAAHILGVDKETK
jgi:malate/lactate dehydrogenase